MSPVAAIDCGSNSIRLLLSDGGIDIDRDAVITGLGRGVDLTGHLPAEGVEHTLEVLADYRRRAADAGVERLAAVATSAVRRAADGDAFLERAGTALGVRPEVLSGEAEARLSFRGATASLDPGDGPFLVVDIGGGSTEFAYGTSECEAAVSTEMGCVRFTEAYIESDPPRPEELVAALSVAEAHIDEVVRTVPEIVAARTLVGLAGTVTTAAAVELGLATHDREATHHFRLGRRAIEDVFRTLVTEPRDDRRHNPGLDPGRLDTIVGGMCILVQVVRQLGVDECLVSECDLLDGLAAQL